MNGNQRPLLANSTIYQFIALKCACLTALAQAPVFLLQIIDAQFVFFGGWIFILGYTFYRVWQLNTRSLIVNDITVVQLLASICAMGISGVFLYGATMAVDNPDANHPAWQIKAAFIINPFAALNVASLAMVATSVIDRIRAVSDWPKC